MIGCIFNYLHKTKPAVASSDKRNPRECEDCYFFGAETDLLCISICGLSP
ncbi:hypothetical protein A8H21_000866 [Salmonella enterica subsp. enterica serovar Oslo]|nr:hypothetical protein [Salmonella enterica subsp. enterica serovar Oslo]